MSAVAAQGAAATDINITDIVFVIAPGKPKDGGLTSLCLKRWLIKSLQWLTMGQAGPGGLIKQIRFANNQICKYVLKLVTPNTALCVSVRLDISERSN